MTTLLFWDNLNAIQICEKVGIAYPEDICFSLEELKQKKNLQVKDSILVLLDTVADNHNRTDFYGIEIIKYLRKELRYKGLILAYSFMSESFFRNLKNGEILFTSGTWLKPILYLNKNEIEELSDKYSNLKLSDNLLDDISYNVFDSKGKIHELLHNLKNKLNNIKVANTLEIFIKETKTVLGEFKIMLLKEIDPFKATELKNLYSTLINETIEDITNHWNHEKDKKNFSYANAGNLVNKFTNQIVELAPVSSDDTNTQQLERINWQVLFFDDTEGVREKVKEYFELKNVTCHLASTEKEVYQKLKQNAQDISLFISDIRILDKNEHWCDRQGYDVIEQVNRTNAYPLVYAVLTSKKGTISKMVQKKRKYEILWFTKDDVINNKYAFNIFFDQIKEYAESNYKANSDFKISFKTWIQPTERGREKPEIVYRFALKDYYKVHFESEDHETAESEINLMVKQILNGNIENTIQWNCRLNANSIDLYELNKFRKNILLGRRLILSYIFSDKKISTKNIYLKSYKKEDYNENTAKTYLSNFCLPNKFDHLYDNIIDYHFGKEKKVPLIKEEYEFLKKEFLDITASDEYELNETELILVKKLFNIFSEIFEQQLDIDRIPLSLKKVNSLLKSTNVSLPSVQLLLDVANEVKDVKIIYNSKEIKKLGLNSISNNVLRDFLKKCNLM